MARVSREKGIAGERELARLLEAAGYTVTGRVMADGTHDPLVRLPGGGRLRFQTKRHERARVWEWLEQAEQDAARDKTRFAVAFRRNRQPWYVALPLDSFLELIRLPSPLNLTTTGEDKIVVTDG